MACHWSKFCWACYCCRPLCYYKLDGKWLGINKKYTSRLFCQTVRYKNQPFCFPLALCWHESCNIWGVIAASFPQKTEVEVRKIESKASRNTICNLIRQLFFARSQKKHSLTEGQFIIIRYEIAHWMNLIIR